jgi:hypothetical protein
MYYTYVNVKLIHILTCMCDCRRGFESEIGFTDHLQAVTANNYTTVPNLHTVQITTADAMSFQFAVSSPVVLW